MSIAEDDEDGLSGDLKLYGVALAIEMLDLASDIDPVTGAVKEMSKIATGVDPFALPGEEQLSDLDKVFIAGWLTIPSTIKGPVKKIGRLLRHLGNTRFIKSSTGSLKGAYDSLVNGVRKTFKRPIPIGSIPLPIPQSTKKSEEMVDLAGKAIGRNPDKTLNSVKKGDWSDVIQDGFTPKHLVKNKPIHDMLRKDKGIPSDWIVGPTTKGKKDGLSFSKPNSLKSDEVRVMPGNPNSPYPNSRKPYVRINKGGKPYDKNGNLLPTDKMDEAHIPLDEFKFPF